MYLPCTGVEIGRDTLLVDQRAQVVPVAGPGASALQPPLVSSDGIDIIPIGVYYNLCHTIGGLLCYVIMKLLTTNDAFWH